MYIGAREFLKSSLVSTAALAIGPDTLNRIIPAIPTPTTRPADYSPAFWKLAPLPVMGWNSWDEFGINVTEDIFLATAQFMQQKLLPLGYRYACIDGGWYFPLEAPHKKPSPSAIRKSKPPRPPASMDSFGRYIPSPTKYPSAIDGAGFKPIADKIHAMGLKFGIHTMRGIPREAYDKNTPIQGTSYFARDAADLNNLCTWSQDNFGIKANAAGQAYYDSVIRMYASWGLDFLKNDDMSRPYHQDEIWMNAQRTGPFGTNIVYSLSPGETPITSGSDVIDQANMCAHHQRFLGQLERPQPYLRRSGVLERFRRFGSLARLRHDVPRPGSQRDGWRAARLFHQSRTAHPDDVVVHRAFAADSGLRSIGIGRLDFFSDRQSASHCRQPGPGGAAGQPRCAGWLRGTLGQGSLRRHQGCGGI